ncbi:MAG: BMP family ABC transporter substrate-binding protein [Ruminococcaceae bacterium]|nr:BMP family ABC transporter substrate-binding protein [Oscillospiraceae bacterium]
MKKIIALLLVLAMVFALAACGDGKTNEAPKNETAKFKAGFIFLHDENSTYDLNFLNATKEACAALGVEYVIKVNIPESEACYDAAAELVEEGCTYIFADSFGHEPYMLQAAKEFPNVQFCHATGTQAHTAGVANYHNAFASIYEGRFLGGVAAGMKLNEMIEAGKFTAEEAKVGYIGAFPYAEVISGMTSFYLGVRYVCPTATMDVTFTNSWYDPTLEQEGAVKLINNDCKLISLHADSMGAPTECQNKGVPFVFYNGSAKEACPDTYIVASYINWAPYMTYSMKAAMNGEPIAADWIGTLENGGVALKELNEAVAAEGTAAKLEEVKTALLNGTLKVFDTATFTVDGKTLDSYTADVDDMGDFVPETEAIKDGYFHESEYRSAPYFDMFIDGITNLDQ